MFSIIFSVGLVRILGQAAGGRVDNQAVFELVALTALVWLPIILTLTLFVSVLMTLTRAYRDSEMVVWFTAGRSLTAWIGPVLRFAWPIVVSIALLALFVTPWSNSQIEEMRERFAQRDDVSRVAPGRFIESGGTDRVFFVESVDILDGQVRNVFVSMRSQGREGLIVAAKGVIELADNGDRFLVLEQGRRYEGTPGKLEYRTMEFDRYAIRLESRADQPIGEQRAKSLTLMQLLVGTHAAESGRDHVAHRAADRRAVGEPARDSVGLRESARRALVQSDRGRAAVRCLSECVEYRAGIRAAGQARLQHRRVDRARAVSGAGRRIVCAPRIHAALVAARGCGP